MGKKYIVEIGRLERLYKAYNNGNGMPNMTWLSPEVDLTPYTEPDMEQVRKEAYKQGYETAKHECEDCTKPIDNGKAYQMGLNDAWEAARKVTQVRKYGGYGDCLEEVFGRHRVPWDVFDYSAPEAVEKIRQYEQEQEEIKVGDEVIPRETEYDTMIVTRSWKDDYDSDCIDTIGFDGRISSFLVSRVSKTGKHYEIAEVLRKMGETNNG